MPTSKRSHRSAKPKHQLTASEMGKLGGKAKLKKYGKQELVRMARKGAEARWGKPSASAKK